MADDNMSFSEFEFGFGEAKISYYTMSAYWTNGHREPQIVSALYWQINIR